MHRPVLHHPDPGHRGHGQLVQPVVTTEHQRVPAATGDHPGDQRAGPQVGDADRVGGRSGRIGHRPEQVERGGDAQFPADGGGVPHRRVEHRRETEPDAHLVDQRRHVGGRERQRHTEVFQHVGGAARRRHRPVAVLDHPEPGTGDDDRRHRGDVHRPGAVPAGADDVDGRARDGHRDRVRVHRPQQPFDLGDGLPLGAQRHQEGRQPGRPDRAPHHLVHRPRGVLRGQILAPQQGAHQNGPAPIGLGHRLPPRVLLPTVGSDVAACQTTPTSYGRSTFRITGAA
ncbi:hypothetical protein B0E53_06259 [Micromonospora sp. MH33]|nr:hypothetical protein B0E53_06259 [Micromonospora sp. MH33]